MTRIRQILPLRLLAAITTLALLTALPAAVRAAEQPAPSVVVVLGDSLVAGYGLDESDAFPQKLEKALLSANVAVKIINAGVSGDTSAGGLARLDWSVPPEASAVIVELGANDALRGLSPDATMQNLDAIITRLQERGIKVLLAGMLSPPNMGRDYEAAFNGIYPALAEKHDIDLYPFFLDGVAGNPELNQPDGMHPTAQGVDEIVTRFLPHAIRFVNEIADKSALR
ncbi:MAG: arylesterase [Nitratireductor sp.]|nr:arylesterase [Nitratireductor sp.]